jgi:FHA domain
VQSRSTCAISAIDCARLGGAIEMTMTGEYAKLMSRSVPTLKISGATRPDAEFDLVLDITSGFDQVVGRDGSADITVPDPTISRRHARITQDVVGVWLEDLGSTNGTYLNGRRLLERYRLRDGDQVKIGNAAAVFYDLIPAPDPPERLDVVRDVSGPPDSTQRHDAIIEATGVPCPCCFAVLGSEMWFCHHCGYQQWPIAMPQAPASVAAETMRRRLIGPHGNIRSRQFRQVMRGRNGGRRPPYSESFVVPALLFRVLLVMAFVVAVVATLVVLGLGVHHFVQLRQQPAGRSIARHSHSFVPTMFPAQVR